MNSTRQLKPRIFRSPAIRVDQSDSKSALVDNPTRRQITTWEKLPSSTWIAEIELPSRGSSKRKRPRCTGKDKADVTARIQDLIDLHAAGVDLGATTTLGDYAEQWVNRPSTSAKWSVRTLENYRWAIEGHIIPRLGKFPLTELKRHHLQTWLDESAQSKDKGGLGLSLSAVKRLKLVVSKVLDNALADDLLVKTPAIALDLPDAPAKVVERIALTRSQAEAVMDQAAEVAPRLEAYVVIGLTSGLRPAELRGLRWEDVNMYDDYDNPLSYRNWPQAHRATITIERQLVQEGNVFKSKPPKSARSRRTIAIHARALKALQVRRRQWNEERLRSGKDLPGEWKQLCFTSKTGRPMDKANTRRSLRRICKAMPSHLWPGRAITPYDMRHTAATLLLADGRGMSLLACADYMGHSPEMLERIYRHAPEVRHAVYDPFLDHDVMCDDCLIEELRHEDDDSPRMLMDPPGRCLHVQGVQ